MLGHERIGTDHLLLAMLDDPASTGAQILTAPISLNISEVRGHPQHNLANRPTPGPPTASPSGSTTTNTPSPWAPPAPPDKTSKPSIHERITDAK
ncbi:Clp protease N-terminal domain-containing protein [Rhodococcus jostii]|uniref:Clp protease N-terminal domain-containing protein n=1 Tax=Rhodococcus jostii TaxID=132919 RepID=UPI000A5069C8|nr:Clp protease N-terminal domain-containing protein [Rhodococcus jostii]